MTMQEINHIKQCGALLRESAIKVNLFVQLKEYKEGKNDFIEIQLRDKNRYLIYKGYEVIQILGFIDGIKYLKKEV